MSDWTGNNDGAWGLPGDPDEQTEDATTTGAHAADAATATETVDPQDPEGTTDAGQTADAEQSDAKPARKSRSGGGRSGGGRSGARKSRRGPLTPGQAKKAVGLIGTLEAMTPQALEATGVLAGVDAERDALAVAILSGRTSTSQATTQALADIAGIARLEGAEAAIATGLLGRARIKAAWDLLRTTGVELTETVPAADLKAALALSEAIAGRTDEQADILDQASTVLAGE